jgi:dipeptidyl aminopeptidase/acylaminoacyl peptidase
MDVADYSKNGIEEFIVKSTVDGSDEPNLFYKADDSEGERPLIVALHSWSFDRHNQVDNFLPICRERNFHLILPEFRGPNIASNPRAPEACASKLAMQDIIDAVEYVKGVCKVDTKNILLFGASGGGHMSMMMAGYAPKLWRSVGAFVGISDVGRWYDDNPSYDAGMEACCGGKPEGEHLLQYRLRSPITYVENIAKAEIVLYHGKWDPSVPFTHSVRLFNMINEKYPKSRVFLEVFDGGHEMRMQAVEKHIDWVFDKNQKEETVTG